MKHKVSEWIFINTGERKEVLLYGGEEDLETLKTLFRSWKDKMSFEISGGTVEIKCDEKVAGKVSIGDVLVRENTVNSVTIFNGEDITTEFYRCYIPTCVKDDETVSAIFEEYCKGDQKLRDACEFGYYLSRVNI